MNRHLETPSPLLLWQQEVLHPLKIPMGIVDYVMSNRYAGDETVHPGYHLLFVKEICGLFKIAGVSIEVIILTIVERQSYGVV